MTQSYNDADQPTSTQTTVGGQTGSTFSQAYDSTTGLLTGLSNNATGIANLATLSFETHGLVSDINFQSTTGSALSNEHFSYNNDLHPLNATATWQSGSGASGTVWSQTRGYDAVGNVISSSSTHATVPGQSSSGGSETQNFCYDELSRLVWAGNSGTQPAAGNGDCGSGTLSNTLAGASYNNSFAYTHLGQLWQGPLNGNGAQQQYLYCDSTHPHQLTGLYPVGTTCATKGSATATYSASYDNWGNVTSRVYNNVTATLGYDKLNRLVQWDGTDNSHEAYIYDAGGQRILRKSSTTGNGTSLTVYAFGSEEHVYDGTGKSTGNTYYYSLGGHLLGKSDGTHTQFFLTDGLGSVISTFTNVAGSASVQGNQVYGPYGNNRYSKGALGTSKGFTGQYHDATGLNYYSARYYDPVVGRFLSADSVQGNAQGIDPYGYVGGNPETLNDPTGHCPWCIIGAVVGAVVGAAVDYGVQVYDNYTSGDSNPWGDINWWQVGGAAVGGALVGGTLGFAADAVGLFGAADATVAAADESAAVAATDVGATATADASAAADAGASAAWDAGATATADAGASATADATASAAADAGASAVVDSGATAAADTSAAAADAGAAAADTSSVAADTSAAAADSSATADASAAASDASSAASDTSAASSDTSAASSDTSAASSDTSSGACSFTPDTHVATDHGEQPIGTLHVGDAVWAYNPHSQKMEEQPIKHVWIHTDDDLVDLTITSTQSTQDGKATQQSSEVVHTNQKHPFLTQEKGFIPVKNLHVGMHVVKADGSVGVITGWHLVPGAKVMYNLEVAQDHTFTVGDGRWVVHNCGEGSAGSTDSSSTSSSTVKLYRAVGQNELNDVLKYGDYGVNPSSGGKYFSFTEQGARDFAASSINAGKNMTVTSTQVPSYWLDYGSPIDDPGGAGWANAIHFDDEIMIEMYSTMSQPTIIDASWVLSIGG